MAKEVLSNLREYLRDHLPVDVDFLSKLQGKHLLADENADKLRTAVETRGGKSGVDGLLPYMSSYYDEETLEKFCVFLEEYSQPARPLLSTIAKRIREDLKDCQQRPIKPTGPSGTEEIDVPPSKMPRNNPRTVSTSSSNSTVPENVIYAIMTANEQEWNSAQYFLGEGDSVSEQVKMTKAKCKNNQYLKEHVEGFMLNFKIPGTTYKFFRVHVENVQKIVVLMKCKIGSFTNGGSLDETFKLLNIAKERNWPLQAIFIVGCCGAIATEGEDQIGAVYVAQHIYYYGLGRIAEDGKLENRFDPYNVNTGNCETQGEENSPKIRVRAAPVLSGDFVMKSEDVAEIQREHLGEKRIGFEMEGVGVVKAVRLFGQLSESPRSPQQSPQVILLKGVSDRVGKKNERSPISFFEKQLNGIDEDTRQQMCTIMSLTIALRAICRNLV